MLGLGSDDTKVPFRGVRFPGAVVVAAAFILWSCVWICVLCMFLSCHVLAFSLNSSCAVLLFVCYLVIVRLNPRDAPLFRASYTVQVDAFVSEY